MINEEKLDSVPAPGWLNELEARRERKIKQKLGHEAGAGSPCTTCLDKCPGLDLHFWRKTCKNCKCKKENHDIQDDDIHSWAEFELLGSRPIKNKTLKLSGRNVKLDWAPKGDQELVDMYLTDLPPELLPIQGSAAAKERKMLLSKQIPCHDIDPNLCHQLTDDEVKKMNDYIMQVKEKSAGVGHLMQIKFDRAAIKSDRVCSMLPNSQVVQLQGSSCTKTIKGTPTKAAEILRNDCLANNAKLPNYSASVLKRNEENLHPESHQQCKSLGKDIHATFGVLNNDNIYLTEKELPYVHERKENNLCQQNKEQKTLNYSTPNTADSLQNYRDLERLSLENNLPNYLQTNLNLVDVDRNPTLQRNFKNKVASLSTVLSNNVANDPDKAPSSFDDTAERKNDAKRLPLPNVAPSNVYVAQHSLQPTRVNVGSINDIVYDSDDPRSEPAPTYETDERVPMNREQTAIGKIPECHRCHKMFNENEMAVGADRTSSLWHTNCFKCAGCNQHLADLLYFFDKETDDVYCLRDYAKIRGIPRCRACDELIFVKEYCLTMEDTFHLKHFCCYECDIPLAGHNYVLDDDQQPVCLPCYESLQANRCNACKNAIKPDEQGAGLMDTHFHANDECFSCKRCRKPLLGGKFLFKDRNLYCSGDCFRADQ